MENINNNIHSNIKLFKYFGGDMRKLLQLAKEQYSVRNMKTTVSLEGSKRILSRDDFMNSIIMFKNKEVTDSYYLGSMYS